MNDDVLSTRARPPFPFRSCLPNPSPATAAHISSIPLSLLRAELTRRQQPDASSTRPACGSGGAHHAYNLPLHVAALFLILLLSTLACSFPLVVRRFPRLPIPNHALFVSRHFGTGVLIATAFVHLLPTAYVSLTDPCLPRFWNDVYPAMSGFISMVSVLAVVTAEMFFATQGAGHSHEVDLEGLRVGAVGGRSMTTQHGHGYDVVGQEDFQLQEQRSPVYADQPGTPNSLNKPLPPEPPFEDDDDSDLDDDPASASDSAALLNGSLHSSKDIISSSNGRPRPMRHVSFSNSPQYIPPRTAPTTDASEQRLILQCLLLEAGILFHSVFIGMALSVSTGAPFIVLLIAISFHQTFEGLALGSRIAAIDSFGTDSVKPWLMSVLYGVTTPIGQAIGLAVQGLYDPASQLGLLMVGIVNAISSGLLIYAGLVQLLAEDFLSEKSYVELSGRRRIQACGAVVAGSMLMAFVGAFA